MTANGLTSEQEIYVVHIGRDDYPALKAKIVPFNILVRRCGGMPIENFDRNRYCCSIAFESNLFREDFARELREKLNVYAVIDFRQAFINRKCLPPKRREDRYDLHEILRMSKEQAEMERLRDGTYEKEYSYPSAKQIPI